MCLVVNRGVDPRRINPKTTKLRKDEGINGDKTACERVELR